MSRTFVTPEEQAQIDELDAEERESEDTSSELDESQESDSAEADPAEEDSESDEEGDGEAEDGAEEESEEKSGDDGEEDEDEDDFIELDGIKFKAVQAADGTNLIPIPVLKQQRKEILSMKEELAKLKAGRQDEDEQPPEPEDAFKHLRSMKASELNDYALESDENAQEVEDFRDQRAIEKFEAKQKRETQESFQQRATKAVKNFIALNPEKMNDPDYYGIVARRFDLAIESGQAPEEAIKTAEAAADARFGIGQPEESEDDPAEKIRSNRQPARTIKGLAGSGNKGSGGDSSPDLNSDVQSVAVRTYRELTPEQREQYRRTGRIV